MCHEPNCCLKGILIGGTADFTSVSTMEVDTGRQGLFSIDDITQPSPTPSQHQKVAVDTKC